MASLLSSEVLSAREPRFAVDLPASIYGFHRPGAPVRLRNLSASGFHAVCEAPLPDGAQVILHIPGVGEVGAQIRWSAGRRCGGLFNSLLDEAQRRALAALMVPAGAA